MSVASKARTGVRVSRDVYQAGSKPTGSTGNMFALGTAVFGGVMLYSAISNTGISQIIRDLISGEDPRDHAGTGVRAIATGERPGAGNSQGFNVPATPTGKVTSPGTADLRGYQTAILKGIGAPLTQQNFAFLDAWARRENTRASNNPYATTQPMPGYDTRFNSVGVRNYTSRLVGIAATIKTLLNGYYGDVVAALRSGHPDLHKYYQGLHTWSGNGYASAS